MNKPNNYDETQEKFSTAKSPMGALEQEIDNDIAAVIKALEEYRYVEEAI